MIELFSSVPDTYNTAVMPVAYQGVMTFLERLNIRHYFKNNIALKSYGDAVSLNDDANEDPNLITSRCNVDVGFSSSHDGLKWATPASNLNLQEMIYAKNSNYMMEHIFYDKLRGIRLVEYNAPMSISLTMELKFDDIVKANDAINKIRSFISTSVCTFNVQYSYILPIEVYGVIYRLFKLTDEDPSTFYDYLRTNSNETISKDVNRHDTSDFALSVRKHTIDLIMSIESTQDQPDVDSSGDSPDYFIVNLVVNSQISMPNILGLVYPIVVNNIEIPEDLIPNDLKIINRYKNMSYPLTDITKFGELIENTRINYTPIKYPFYDTWVPNLPNNYILILSNVFTLDDINNPEGITELDLKAAFFDTIPEIINTLKQLSARKDAVWKSYDFWKSDSFWENYFTVDPGNDIFGFNTMFHIAIYKDNAMMVPTEFIYDPETLKISTGVRDKNSIYRFIIAFNPYAFAKMKEFRIMNTSIILKK